MFGVCWHAYIVYLTPVPRRTRCSISMTFHVWPNPAHFLPHVMFADTIMDEEWLIHTVEKHFQLHRMCITKIISYSVLCRSCSHGHTQLHCVDDNCWSSRNHNIWQQSQFVSLSKSCMCSLYVRGSLGDGRCAIGNSLVNWETHLRQVIGVCVYKVCLLLLLAFWWRSEGPTHWFELRIWLLWYPLGKVGNCLQACLYVCTLCSWQAAEKLFALVRCSSLTGSWSALGALGGKRNVPLCLESEMGPHASQHVSGHPLTLFTPPTSLPPPLSLSL